MAASIVLLPTTDPVGTSVKITGAGFALLSAITFKYNNVAITATDGPITSDGTGAFTAHITVPPSPEGTIPVKATDASAGNASANYAVESAVSLSVASGPVGTQVTLTGTGFAANSLMAFTIGDQVVVPNGGPVTTDSNGSFSAILTIPEAGIETVSITAEDASSNSVSNNFAITGVNILPLVTETSFSSYTPGFTDFLKAYKYSPNPFLAEVNNDSYYDVCAIDARGCSELDVQIANTGNANGLTYELYGLLAETANPPAFDATKYSIIGSPANVAEGTSTYVAITDPFSWVLVRVKHQTSAEDTTMAVYGRQKQ